MKITKDFLEKGMKRGIGATSTQIKLLGLSYPPMKGWKKSMIGKEIDAEKAELYLSLKGVDKYKASKRISKINNKRKMDNLDHTILQKPIADVIKDIIKNKPINFDGLVILNLFLEKIQKGIELTESEISMVKKSEILYKDRNMLAMNDSYVYLMYDRKDHLNRTIVKIGYSKNPRSRLASLKTANPKIQLIAYEHGSKILERKLHNYFEKFLIDREWFAFPMTKNETIQSFRDAIKEVKRVNEPTRRYKEEMLRKWKI